MFPYDYIEHTVQNNYWTSKECVGYACVGILIFILSSSKYSMTQIIYQYILTYYLVQ